MLEVRGHKATTLDSERRDTYVKQAFKVIFIRRYQLWIRKTIYTDVNAYLPNIRSGLFFFQIFCNFKRLCTLLFSSIVTPFVKKLIFLENFVKYYFLIFLLLIKSFSHTIFGCNIALWNTWGLYLIFWSYPHPTPRGCGLEWSNVSPDNFFEIIEHTFFLFLVLQCI